MLSNSIRLYSSLAKSPNVESVFCSEFPFITEILDGTPNVFTSSLKGLFLKSMSALFPVVCIEACCSHYTRANLPASNACLYMLVECSADKSIEPFISKQHQVATVLQMGMFPCMNNI